MHDPEVARRYVSAWPDAAQRLADRFWPGPLTLVLPKHSAIVDEVTAGKGTVGLRVPDHAVALDLLRAADRPIAAPSANRSNRISPTTAQHVREELGDRVDLILDGGPCTVGIESTVLDLSGDEPLILRPGAITAAMIEPLVGPVRTFAGAIAKDTAAASPGQQEVHYAPTTPAYRYEAAGRCRLSPEGNGLVTLGDSSDFRRHGSLITMPNDAGEYARRLYGVLRELDAMGLRAIYVEMPPGPPRVGRRPRPHPPRDAGDVTHASTALRRFRRFLILLVLLRRRWLLPWRPHVPRLVLL